MAAIDKINGIEIVPSVMIPISFARQNPTEEWRIVYGNEMLTAKRFKKISEAENFTRLHAIEFAVMIGIIINKNHNQIIREEIKKEQL